MADSDTGAGQRADRPAGWVHHPGLPVVGPLDHAFPLPAGADARKSGPLASQTPLLHLVYTDDGLYIPAISCRPSPARFGAGPYPTVISIHGGSGGLGLAYLTDQVHNQGYAVEALLERGFAVVVAEGRCENEDAYESGAPRVLDHHDMVAVFGHICRQDWADPTRVGFLGVSHGGELQLKVACELGRTAAQGAAALPQPAALVMCEPAVIEVLGLRYTGERREANLQFQAPLTDGAIDLERARERLARLSSALPMLVIGRDEDHLQGLFLKLHELLVAAGKQAEWATFSHPEHAYQLGPRRDPEGYRPVAVQIATLALAIDFLERHLAPRSAPRHAPGHGRAAP